MGKDFSITEIKTRFSLPLDEFPELPDSKPFALEQELKEKRVYYFTRVLLITLEAFH